MPATRDRETPEGTGFGGTIIRLHPWHPVSSGCRGELSDEHELHARALALPDGAEALSLWLDLAARGNPDAPEQLRFYARCDDPLLRDPAREALEDMELSHDEPMP